VKILLLEAIHDDARHLLSEAGEIICAERLDTAYVGAAIAEADTALTRGRGRLPREVLQAGTKLKCVARCGVGTDNIDVEAATELGIPVIYAPGSTTMAVAEHALMLMLSVARRVTRFNTEVKNNNWAFRNVSGMTIELRGKTLGILGLGDIGKRIAELGQAFGMNVIYWSRNSHDGRFTFLAREEVLRQADVLSISLALTPETRHLIDQAALALMKPTAILINTARGEIVDEAALIEALQANKLAGAGLDVLEDEIHPENNPLWQCDNVIATPHVAAITDVTYREMCVTAAEEVLRILRGARPTPRLVRNPTVL
jgi:D-3-phosphoglycerate dehydrogenase / 2-oxoglutarate reductase